MKAFIFVVLILSAPLAFAKQVTVTIPDDELAIVETFVPSATTYLMDQWKREISDFEKRIVATEIEKSINANETIPAGKTAIIERYLSRPENKPKK